MKKPGRVRLDNLLVTRGFFTSREAAKRAIMAGLVSRNHEVLDKPGTFVREDEPIEVVMTDNKFVGRGGYKLERALSQFSFDLQGKVVVDVGASTGGFTDCALQNGARHVYSVDVGYGQLAWKLRTDNRVTVMERTNFRLVEVSAFSEQPDVAVMDVSFISTKLLIPKLVELLPAGGDIISLVKPQFEAGREYVGKGGIVRDPKVHYAVLSNLLHFIYEQNLTCRGIDFSPISGGDGNLEYLAWWKVETDERSSIGAWQARAKEVVIEAWDTLRNVDVRSDLTAN